MPQSPNPVSVENSFTGGLKTEFTGLNFPENACTDTDNCVFSIIGDVTRRLGMDYEPNYSGALTVNRASKAMSNYRWLNAGGDGSTQVYVLQIGGTLYFYKTSDATVASPMSTTKLASTVILSTYSPVGATAPDAVECQYTDGNGYLFVFHPYLEPFFCSYDGGTITATKITVSIRDVQGIPESKTYNTFRPLSLSGLDEHQYNLGNQGWLKAQPAESATSTSTVTVGTGSKTFTIAAGLSLSASETVRISTPTITDADPTVFVATVTSYVGTTLVVNVVDYNGLIPVGTSYSSWTIEAPDPSRYFTKWFADLGNYPSNSDVWWRFKNASGDFDPAATVDRVTGNQAPAPKGYFILSAFNQNRNITSSIVGGITTIKTTLRPKTGIWFQGRVWYAGVDSQQAAAGDMPSYSWSENLYFSQIVTNPSQFGSCYQENDPTSENLFDLLPSDGGTIRIQGCGSVYKLFPIQSGLLVFAANGIWLIKGNQGPGFTATDYAIIKLSSVQSISSTSFVSVQGTPVFWNEEGIYTVSPGKENIPYEQGGLTVNNIALGSILSFYADIPVTSKKYARGDYDPLGYTIKWVYRDSQEEDVTTRYEFNRVLNFNVHNQAFYPYTIAETQQSTPHVHGVTYIVSPGGSTAPDPTFKFLTSTMNAGTYNFTFSEEWNPDYLDWNTYDGVGSNYSSYFITGYKVHGQAQRLFQMPFVYIYSRNEQDTSYKIQGIWNYASSGDSGKYSSIQLITNDRDNFDKLYRRHRIRGHGTVLQIKVLSVNGEPFDIMGWSTFESQNQSV